MTELNHPGKYLIQELRDRSWTQKYFSQLMGKKVSEVNELIKGKRNITIQWDLLLSSVLGSPEKFWMNKQIDYDYTIAKENFDESKIQKPEKYVVPSPTKPSKSVNQIKKDKTIQKNNTHEGIFRNF